MDNQIPQPFTRCVGRFRNSECVTRKFSPRVLVSAGRVPGRFERPPLRDGGRLPGASRRRKIGGIPPQSVRLYRPRAEVADTST